MKRVCLIALLTMLLLTSACVVPELPAIAAATPMPKAFTPAPTPKATGRPTPKPTREPAGKPSEFAKQYCKEYGLEYQKEYDEAFFYAKNTLPSDFYLIRPEFPEKLYRHPYNLWVGSRNQDYPFKSNVECLEAYGFDRVVAVMKAAKGYAQAYANRDYTGKYDDKMYRDLYFYMPSSSETEDSSEEYLETEKINEIIQIGTLITDRALVYQADDGYLRVRGRAFVKLIHASDSYLEEYDVKLNTWYWFDIEYMVLEDIPIEDSEYPHSMYVVYDWVYIPYVWKEADASMIALAEANMA